jgi:hypothetical protein
MITFQRYTRQKNYISLSSINLTQMNLQTHLTFASNIIQNLSNPPNIIKMGESKLWWYIWTRKCIFLLHFVLFWKHFFPFHVTFKNPHKKDSWYKTSNTILATFQMIIFFNKLLCIHTFIYACWMKNLI